MEIVIYLDSLFLFNVLVNYWILKILTYKFSLARRLYHVLFAAIIGATIYVLMFFVPYQTKYIQMIEICLSVPTMLFILLPKIKRHLFVQVLAYGFFYSFVIAGILRTVFAKWQVFSERKIHIFAVLTGIYMIVEAILYYLHRQKFIKTHTLCKVKLKTERSDTSVTALLDTGNSLLEPISKKPVCIVEAHILEKLVPKEHLFLRAIPYHSIGCEQGVLYGVEIEGMDIVYGIEQFHVTKVICAKSPHKLSTRGMYDMILHPQCVSEEYKVIQRGEKDVVRKRSEKKILFTSRTRLVKRRSRDGNSLYRWNGCVAATFRKRSGK